MASSETHQPLRSIESFPACKKSFLIVKLFPKPSEKMLGHDTYPAFGVWLIHFHKVPSMQNHCWFPFCPAKTHCQMSRGHCTDFTSISAQVAREAFDSWSAASYSVFCSLAIEFRKKQSVCSKEGLTQNTTLDQKIAVHRPFPNPSHHHDFDQLLIHIRTQKRECSFKAELQTADYLVQPSAFAPCTRLTLRFQSCHGFFAFPDLIFGISISESRFFAKPCCLELELRHRESALPAQWSRFQILQMNLLVFTSFNSIAKSDCCKCPYTKEPPTTASHSWRGWSQGSSQCFVAMKSAQPSAS